MLPEPGGGAGLIIASLEATVDNVDVNRFT